MNKSLKSPLRYAGGKSRAIYKLHEFCPDMSKMTHYSEPFLGGGSMAIYMTKTYPHLNISVYDNYIPLICFWLELRDNCEELQETLKSLMVLQDSMPDPKDMFLTAKNVLKKLNPIHAPPHICCNPTEIASAFYLVNKQCFGGVMTGGFSRGAYERNWNDNQINNLKLYSDLIKNWDIHCKDYTSCCNYWPPWMRDRLIYCDPPYLINSHLYSGHSAFNKEVDAFWKWCKRTNCPILISYNNVKTPLDDEPEFKRSIFDLKYSMVTQGEKYDKDGKEVVIWSGY